MKLKASRAWTCVSVIRFCIPPIPVVAASRRCPVAPTGKHPRPPQRNTEVCSLKGCSVPLSNVAWLTLFSLCVGWESFERSAGVIQWENTITFIDLSLQVDRAFSHECSNIYPLSPISCCDTITPPLIQIHCLGINSGKFCLQPAVFFLSEAPEMEVKEMWSPSFMSRPFCEQAVYGEFHVQAVNLSLSFLIDGSVDFSLMIWDYSWQI